MYIPASHRVVLQFPESNSVFFACPCRSSTNGGPICDLNKLICLSWATSLWKNYETAT